MRKCESPKRIDREGLGKRRTGTRQVTEYKQIPLAENESDEKRIRKVLKDVESQREKRKMEKAKKANKFKPGEKDCEVKVSFDWSY